MAYNLCTDRTLYSKAVLCSVADPYPFDLDLDPGNKGFSSVADLYHFDTDPDLDPGCEKIRYGSGSRVNFDTDPDPG